MATASSAAAAAAARTRMPAKRSPLPLLLLLLLAASLLPGASPFTVDNNAPFPHTFRPTLTTTTGGDGTGTSRQPSRASSPTHLEAKKSGKKKKTSGGGGAAKGGGFGRKPAAPTAGKDGDDDEFAAFPPLEDGVKATLLPSSPASIEKEGEDLSGEMYDRLSQIYGFESFNFAGGEEPEKDVVVKEEEAAAVPSSPSVSFDDLLSSGGGGGTASSSSSASSDFGDLLGGSKSSSSSSSSSSDFADLIASASGGSTSSSPKSKTGVTPAPVADLDLSSLPPFTDFRVLHVDPMVLAVDDFFTPAECDKYVNLALRPDDLAKDDASPTVEIRSRTVGTDSRARAQRSSTTWFNHYRAVPELMAKASRLLGLSGIGRWEEPQTVRYRRTEKFTWHLDALAPSPDLGSKGGQRIATLLVYLTDLDEGGGGATMFRDLGGEDGPLKVRPKKGSALLFFPAAGGIPNVPFDIRTLHCGEAVSESSSNEKWISQLWLRESAYAPTAPPGNDHAAAAGAINDYCKSNASGD